MLFWTELYKNCIRLFENVCVESIFQNLELLCSNFRFEVVHHKVFDFVDIELYHVTPAPYPSLLEPVTSLVCVAIELW